MDNEITVSFAQKRKGKLFPTVTTTPPATLGEVYPPFGKAPRSRATRACERTGSKLPVPFGIQSIKAEF